MIALEREKIDGNYLFYSVVQGLGIVYLNYRAKDPKGM